MDMLKQICAYIQMWTIQCLKVFKYKRLLSVAIWQVVRIYECLICIPNVTSCIYIKIRLKIKKKLLHE